VREVREIERDLEKKPEGWGKRKRNKDIFIGQEELVSCISYFSTRLLAIK
jgi:hypothetical protein